MKILSSSVRIIYMCYVAIVTRCIVFHGTEIEACNITVYFVCASNKMIPRLFQELTTHWLNA